MANTDAIAKLLKDVNKVLGDNTVTTANNLPEVRKVRVFPSYDYLCGGGIPVGRIIEHVGPAGSFKSGAAYMAAASFQKQEFPTCAENLVGIVDVEGTYTKNWGTNFGIDNSRLLLSKPSSLEKAVDLTDFLLRDPNVSLVVFDSMQGTGAAGEVEKSMEDEQMGINARFWNKAIRKFLAAMNSNPNKIITLIVINGVYDKVGFVMGNPETSSNGKQLKYAKTLSVHFRAGQTHKLKNPENGVELPSGRHYFLKTSKFKLGVYPLDSEIYVPLSDIDGAERNKPDETHQIIELASKLCLVDKKGSWFYVGEEKFQGKDALIQALREDVAFIDSLREKLYEQFEIIHE